MLRLHAFKLGVHLAAFAIIFYGSTLLFKGAGLDKLALCKSTSILRLHVMRILEGFENADLSVRIRCFISRQLESGGSWRDAFTCGLARDVTPESALAECGFGAPGG